MQLTPLTFVRTGANLAISWPTSAWTYALESTTNLNPPVAWSPVTDAVLVPGVAQTTLLVPIGANNRFFRLHRTTTPVLTLSLSHSANDVTIAWPVNPWYAYLESKTALNAPGWTPATNPPPTVVGDQNRVTLRIGSTNQFFRLHGTQP